MVSHFLLCLLAVGKRITQFGQVPETTTPELGVFEIIANAPISSIHSVLVPTTGKVILLERYDGGEIGTAHSYEFDYYTGLFKSLSTLTDIFCSTGFVSSDPNGRIYNVGGWDGPSLNAVRYYQPCGNPGYFDKCDWKEDDTAASLLKPRWYPTALPLASGKVAIIGGTDSPAGLPPPAPNAKNQPNVEFLPLDPLKEPIELSLLVETDTYNLYPIAHLLSNGQVFLMAGDRSQVLDPESFEIIFELPAIPDGYRTYPYTSGSVLLSLTKETNWESEVLVCGGTTEANVDAVGLSSCGRIKPLDTNPNWEMFLMPGPRVMPDMVLLADGTVLIINGASYGCAGFALAQDPILTGWIYNPADDSFKPTDTSTVARMYHSEAMLLEDGSVLILGSAPNAKPDEKDAPYPNEKRIEIYYPPYLLTGKERPVIATPKVLNANNIQTIQFYLNTKFPETTEISIFTNGFVTHSNHQGQRRVILEHIAEPVGEEWYVITAEVPGENLVPPGHYLLFARADGVPSIAKNIWIGNDIQNFAEWPN